MDNNSTVAINEAEINKIMLEVIDCSNKLKTILNKVNDEIDRLKSSYQGSAADVLYSQYEQFNDSYSIIIDNILSYNSDLMSLKRKYNDGLSKLSDKIRADARKVAASSVDVYKEMR